MGSGGLPLHRLEGFNNNRLDVRKNYQNLCLIVLSSLPSSWLQYSCHRVENAIRKCSKSIHEVLLSFSSSQHPFVWLLKAPQLSGAMLLFDCFLSPQLLLVKILAVALVGTFRELLIGSQELRLARAETLRNDGGRNWCFGCLVCNVESFSTAQLRSRDEFLRYYRPNKKNLSQKWHSSPLFSWLLA